MTPRWAFVLRALLALEFAAALGAWAISDLPWWLACLVATSSLTVFLLTYPDPHGPGEASERLRAVALVRRPFAPCRCAEYRAHPIYLRCMACGGDEPCRCIAPARDKDGTGACLTCPGYWK